MNAFDCEVNCDNRIYLVLWYIDFVNDMLCDSIHFWVNCHLHDKCYVYSYCYATLIWLEFSAFEHGWLCYVWHVLWVVKMLYITLSAFDLCYMCLYMKLVVRIIMYENLYVFSILLCNLCLVVISHPSAGICLLSHSAD